MANRVLITGACGVAILLLGYAQNAVAGDVSCAWNILTDSQRDNLLASTTEPAVLPTLNVSSAESDRIKSECNYNFSNPREAGHSIFNAIIARSYELQGIERLKYYEVEADQVDKFWNSLSVVDKATIEAWVSFDRPPAANDPAVPKMAAVMVQFITILGLPPHDDGANGALLSYLAGRINRQQYESNF